MSDKCESYVEGKKGEGLEAGEEGEEGSAMGYLHTWMKQEEELRKKRGEEFRKRIHVSMSNYSRALLWFRCKSPAHSAPE